MGSLDTVDPTPRLDLLNAMPPHEGDDTIAVTSTWISNQLGKSAATIDQMLYALRADRLVEFQEDGRRRLWHRTAEPIPDRFTSTAAMRDADSYTDLALREALGIPLVPPTPKAVSCVRKLVK